VIRACLLRDKTTGREVFAPNPPCTWWEGGRAPEARQTKKMEIHEEEGKEKTDESRSKGRTSIIPAPERRCQKPPQMSSN